MKFNGKIVIIEDENLLRKNIFHTLEKEGYEVAEFGTGQQGLSYVINENPDIVLMDIRLEDSNGVDLLKKIRESTENVSVIMMTAYGTMETVIECIRSGAENFIKKPFKLDELRLIIKSTVEKRKLKDEINYLRKLKHPVFGKMVGKSQSVEKVFKSIEKVAKTQVTVLISGESGTGKQVVAREIHDRSERADKSFIEINCGAIPENLLESELFGHVKGSFTGAVNHKKGLFFLANGGTLFLDEIAEMPLATQVKLLKAIEDRTIRPVGSEKEYHIDVRIIGATNKILEEQVKNGDFREDLYYRLNVFPIVIPPLRERNDDPIYLAQYFLSVFNKELNKKIIEIDEEAKKMLVEYSWPGNIRELKNTIERAVLHAENGIIKSEDLGIELKFNKETKNSELGTNTINSIPEGVSLEDYLLDIEKKAIEEVLIRNRYNQSKTAQELGLTREKLRYRMNRHRLM